MLKKLAKKILPSVRYGSQIDQTVSHIEYQQQKILQQLQAFDEKQEYLFWLNQRRENEPLSETKKRVFQSLPPAEGQLRETQLVNLYILKMLKEVCDANNIRFFLMWGSLLGAVRHKGFIPWDDDMDIGMLWDDYLRLKEVLRDHPRLYVQTYFNYENPMGMIKVRLQDAAPFFVDIFPLDYVESPNVVQTVIPEFRKTYFEKLNELFQQHYDLKKTCPPFLGNLEIEQTMEDFVSNIRLSNPKIGKGDYLTHAICSVYSSEFVFCGKEVFPLETVLFEGELFDVPQNRDQLLKAKYGDIWHFPKTLAQRHTGENSYAPTEYRELIEEARKHIKAL